MVMELVAQGDAGRRVAMLRRARAVSLRELSARTGISYQSIHDIENGRHEPRPSTLKVLALALGVRVEVLTGVEPLPWEGK